MATIQSCLGVNNDVEVAVQAGNIGTGFTRSLIESYLMQDGLPIYASSYTYDDSSLAKVATHRDPRLAIFLKVPGQINCFKNMSSTEDHFVEIEPKPNITSKTPETAYYTGYAIRKVEHLTRHLRQTEEAKMRWPCSA